MAVNFYTGVGSRETPSEILTLMREIASQLWSREGYVLRSGGAVGADTAFEAGVYDIDGRADIYRVRGQNAPGRHINRYSDETWQAALDLAAQVHPAWHRCSDFAKGLHARNCFQVLGMTLQDPSKFLVCWTRDGAETEQECSINTGGTATAIRLAHRCNVEVFNLARPESLKRINDWLQ